MKPRTRITIDEEALKIAGKGILSSEQVKALWKKLAEVKQTPRMAKFIYYLGALFIIAAMSWFMTLGWSGEGLFLIALIYGIVLFSAGFTLWHKEGLRIPGGLLVTAGVCMVPLAVFGLEKYFNIWPTAAPEQFQDYFFRIKGSWLIMNLATVLVGFIALYFVRFPFLIAPVVATLWLTALNLTALILHAEAFDFKEQCWTSLFFGLALLIVSYLIDRRTKEDFAFWTYFFGTAAFGGGFFFLTLSGDISWLLFAFISLFTMILSVLLERSVLMLFGALGLVFYLGHLAYEVFAHSAAFPIMLSLLGLLVIAAGILYQKKSAAIKAFCYKLLPASLHRYLPKNR